MNKMRKSNKQAKEQMKRNASQVKRAGSVQQTFCPILEVEHEAITLKTAGALEWLAVLEVEGLNYSLRSEEEQYRLNEQFQQLLVALPHPLQILLRIVPIDLESYLSLFAPTHKPEAAALADPDPTFHRRIETWTRLATSHVEFMKKRAASQPLLERRFYLVIPALADSVQEGTETTFTRLFHLPSRRKQARAATASRAQHALSIRCQDLERKLHGMGLLTHRLSNAQLMELTYTCLRPREARTYPLLSSWIEGVDRLVTMDPPQPQVDPAKSLASGKPLSPLNTANEGEEGLLPMHWPQVADLVAPACIQVLPDHVKIEQDYVQVLDVHTLPRQVSPGWFNQLMHIDEVMDISLFYIPQPSAATMSTLRRKHVEMHSSTLLDAEHDRYPDPGRVAAQQDIERLMEGIATGHDRVLEFAMHVLIRGESRREMQARVARIRAMLYSMQLGSRVAYFEQEKGIRACLPYAQNTLRTNEHPLILGSHEASCTFPFLSQTLFEVGGILEGITRQGAPVVVNWWGGARRNANRLIVGPSGSGKTFKVHMDIDRLFLRYGKKLFEQQDNAMLPFQCIVVDIEREFRRHTMMRGGQWIRLAPGTRQCINPFDLPQAHRSSCDSHQYVEYTLADKIADIQALLDVMLAEHDAQGRGQLSNQEKGLLDQAIALSYRNAGITEDRATHHRTPPLLHDLYDILKSEVCGEDTTGLSDRLHRFVEGSLAGLFSGQTNVALDAPLQCFDIHDLPTDLRPIAIFLLSHHVWNSSFGSTIPILFVVDELASLFQYEEGRRFIEALFQRARKHNLSVVGVTQYVGILTNSSIPTNSATTILMAQEAASLDQVQQIFRLSEAEVRELRTFGKGDALLLMGEQHFAVRFEASDSEYEIATSDPADLARLVHDEEKTIKEGTAR